MNFKMNTLRIASGLAIGLAAAPSLAQVAPPPTKPAKEQPTYTPAPPTPAPQATPQPTPPKPKPAMNARTRDRGDVSDLPINVPYPKLAQPGPDGRILRLRQLPDIAAMRSNPNIGPKSVEKIMPVVYSRRFLMEAKLIDNLDLYWELSGGLIENLNMSNLKEMSRAAEMLKPLVAPNTLSQQLLNMGILTRIQGGMNNYIVREYKKAITDEIQVLDGDKGLEEVMRFVLDDSLLEARIAYNAMLAEAIGQIGGLVDKSGATSPEAQALREFEKTLTADPFEQFNTLAEFDEQFRKLSFEEAMSIFVAMRENRKFIEISPTIKTIEVLHDRKVIGSEDSFNTIVKDRNDKVIYDTTKKDDDSPAEEKQDD
jgi:hypothetical protein